MACLASRIATPADVQQFALVFAKVTRAPHLLALTHTLSYFRCAVYLCLPPALSPSLSPQSVIREHLKPQMQCNRCGLLCRGRVDLWRGDSRRRCARGGTRMQFRPRSVHVRLLGCDWGGSASACALSTVVGPECTVTPLPSLRWRRYL